MIQAMQPDTGIAVVPFIFCAFLPETLPRRTFTSSGWSSTPWVSGRLYFLSTLPRAMPWEVTEKGTRLKLHSLFLNFNSCPRSISSFKSGILFWTGI